MIFSYRRPQADTNDQSIKATRPKRSLKPCSAVGDAIPRKVDLCERFGVSRSTVRSALQKRVNAGLRVRVSGQGARVCELSAWHLLDPWVGAHGWRARPSPIRICSGKGRVVLADRFLQMARVQ